MAEATPERRHADASRQGLRQEGFEALNDLMRHGYVPQAGAEPQPDGILLQHASAPDLLLKPDGTIGVPAGQRVRSGSEPGVPAEKRIWWRRVILLVLAAAILWFFAVVVTVNILAD